MNAYGSGLAAPFASAPAELRATFNKLLTIPAPKPAGPVVVNMTDAELEAATERNRQRIALGALLTATEVGLDTAAAVTLAAEFMREFDAATDAYFTALVGGAL